MMFPEQDYLTVSQLNFFIQEVLHAGFPESVWVCGEIQGYDRSRTKKHVFFDLCEKDGETKDVVAKIGLVIFSNRRPLIDKILAENGHPFELKDDIEVRFLCKVDFYPPHGALRLIVEEIDPAYTLGKIAAEKQRLIALLKKKGILDRNKQLSLSEVPLRIGLITSYDSAAYNDFLSELRLSGFGFQVAYRNALMQGKGAEDDICLALDDCYQQAENFDVLIITRGGGSIADLSCFDSQKIAEKIACSPLPVLSGIGHEIDLTITDLAAHSYQKTPTAVAKFLVARVENALALMDEGARELFNGLEVLMRRKRDGLRELASELQQEVQSFLRIHDRELTRAEEAIERGALRRVFAASESLESRKTELLSALKRFLAQEDKRIRLHQRFIEASDPLVICRRGFTITRAQDGTLVRSVHDISKHQKMITVLRDGQIKSIVENISE